MIYISNFSSLSFKTYRNYFEEEKEYVQCFSKEDNIVVMTNGYVYDIELYVKDLSTGEEILADYLYSSSTTKLGRVAVFDIKRDVGDYEATIRVINDDMVELVIAKAKFSILPDECLENTVKISYTNKKNDLGCIFIQPHSGTKIAYDIRLPGGIIFRENNYSVDDEMFRDQDYVGQLTSAYPYYNNKLTIGDADGVPEWVGLKLNAIFSLSTITINGKSYRRKDDAVPERTEIAGYYPLYVWKLEVEPDDFYGDDFDLSEAPINALTNNFGVILTNNAGKILTE